MLATSYNDTVRILDTSNDFTEITTLKYETEFGFIVELLFSPDNTILAIVFCLISKIHILKHNMHVKTLDHNQHKYNIVCFSPDSKYLALNSDDNIIQILDCDDNFNNILNIELDILSLQYSIDGRFLLVENTHNEVIFLDSSNNYVKIEELSLSDVNDIAISPCGKFLVYTSLDIVTILDCYCNFNILKHINGLDCSINVMNFSPDGNFLAIGYNIGKILILDCNNDFNQTLIQNTTNDDIINLCFSHLNNGKMYLAINYNNIIKIFDCYDNFNEIYTLESISKSISISFAPITYNNENFLIALSFINDKATEVWDCNNEFNKKHIFKNTTSGIWCFENEIKSTVLW